MNYGGPLPEYVFNQGVFLRPQRIKLRDNLIPRDSDQRNQQQWVDHPSGESNFDRVGRAKHGSNHAAQLMAMR